MSSSPCHGVVSVVVVTYEWPEALDVVLRALFEQDDPAFEVVVADDGSGPATAEVVEPVAGERRRAAQARLATRSGMAAREESQPRCARGARRLPRLPRRRLPREAGLPRSVRRGTLPGWFLSGKRLHLSERLSRRVIDDGVPVWRWSAARSLLASPRELVGSHREAGRPGVLIPMRDRRRPWREGQPEFFSPFAAYGYFFGISKPDFERANGFDMRFESWGGEDEDLAARLRRLGLRCGWPGPSATLLHLWHPPRKGEMPSNTPLVEQTESADTWRRRRDYGAGRRVRG